MKKSTQEAVKYLKNKEGTLYKIRKKILEKGYSIDPISLTRYYKGAVTMKQKTADIFFDVFGIEIEDVYNPKGTRKW